MQVRWTTLAIGLALLTPQAAWAAQADPAGIEFFEKNIRPVFADNCYQCHSSGAEKLRGGLKLDTPADILKGGEDGLVITPGDPDHSTLIDAVKRSDPDTAMPPKKALSDKAVADLVTWVKMGAPMPAQTVAAPGQLPGAISSPIAEYPRWRATLWSWQPIANPPVPSAPYEQWASGPIDHFILAKLEEKDLQPSPPADKLTLIRRITFDLIGLPPTPKEIEDFVRDSSPDAYAKVVDRLLASPHFGERWGRHWLDVARYGESTGMTRNLPYYYAWEYRDYVIHAFNEDKPYNRFITEQLAGDLLPANSPAEHDQNEIATGFLAMGPKDFNEKDPQQFLMNNVDEQIDVTGRALMATTIGCARCHDHKFDPIPTTEYYGLAGIFRSTISLTGLQRFRAKNIDFFNPNNLVKLSDYHGSFGTASADADDPPRMPRRTPAQKAAGAGYILGPNMLKPVPTSGVAMGVMDSPNPGNTVVLIRGELDNRGPFVNRGFLSIPAITDPPTIDPRHSGRLELAEWITRTDNPLTARVIVNRIWLHLFGQGIVRTPDNFGASGDTPTHPELLDYLATQFVKQDNWSVKKMIRTIVLSSVYQQASTFDKAKYAIDPDDRLLWRQSQRRLEAEPLRDAMYYAAGDLNPAPMAGSQIMTLIPAQIFRIARRGDLELGQFSTYRSVYLPIYREAVPEVLDTFDGADPNYVSGQRDVTTVAPQALFMLNSPVVQDQAGRMAARLEVESHSMTAQIDLAYRLTLGRPANSFERSRAEAFITGFARGDSNSMHRLHDGLAAFCQALFASAEFRYLN
jgi:mono/diheme cytochrome c family protein